MANHAGEPVTIKNAVCIVCDGSISRKTVLANIFSPLSTKKTTVCSGSIPISAVEEKLMLFEAESW